MKYTNADICELVAKLEGFIVRGIPSLFNINEWYGFNNSSQQIAYFKVCQGADKNGTGKYNFYRNKLEELHTPEQFGQPADLHPDTLPELIRTASRFIFGQF